MKHLNFGARNIHRMLPAVAAIAVVDIVGIKMHVDTFTAYVIYMGSKADGPTTSLIAVGLFRYCKRTEFRLLRFLLISYVYLG